MAFYPDELIEEVRSRNDIVDIIGSYVRLQKKGKHKTAAALISISILRTN